MARERRRSAKKKQGQAGGKKRVVRKLKKVVSRLKQRLARATSKVKSKRKPQKKKTPLAKKVSASMSTPSTYASFFQAFALKRTTTGLSAYTMKFNSTVAVYGVARNASGGTVLFKPKGSPIDNVVTLTLTNPFGTAEKVMLYVFTEKDDANAYAAACTSFTTTEQENANKGYVPDVDFSKQNSIRTAWDTYTGGGSLSSFISSLLGIYNVFSTYQPGIVPSMVATTPPPCPSGSVVAAPGQPPGWFPPQ